MDAATQERHRQAAYLYSIIQSAENSEGGEPNTDVERAFDAGIMYAARLVLDNESGDNDWTVDLYEYADEIHRRSVPGTPLPDSDQAVVRAAREWREMTADGERDEETEHALAAAVDALDPDLG